LGSGNTPSRNKVRRHNVDEFSGGNDLGLLPELRKMPLVAGYQVVRTYGVSTFEEFVVIGIFRDLKFTRRGNATRMVLYQR